MKSIFSSIPVLILFFILLTMSSAQAADPEKEITESYISADYARTASLLEKDIVLLKNKQQDTKNVFVELYIKYLWLSHIYAWKLNNPEEALRRYKELIQLRQSYKDSTEMPGFELLYIADVYEWKKDLSKAEEYYQKFLKELISLRENEHDDVSIIFDDELIRFTKYQIDSINIKNNKALLLPELKLSSIMLQNIIPFFYIAFSPIQEYETALVTQTGLTEYIKKSPDNISYMFFNFSLILSAAGDYIDESSEEAMTTYIKKYPESYFALLLRYMFYQYYVESDQKKKTVTLMTEIEAIGHKRGMRLITGPDERFSSPEKTWATYKKALMEGDIPLALECYVGGETILSQVSQDIDLNQLKEMAVKMGPIEKITSDQTTATYRITGGIEGEDITFDIHFININGEWKISE